MYSVQQKPPFFCPSRLDLFLMCSHDPPYHRLTTTGDRRSNGHPLGRTRAGVERQRGPVRQPDQIAACAFFVSHESSSTTQRVTKETPKRALIVPLLFCPAYSILGNEGKEKRRTEYWGPQDKTSQAVFFSCSPNQSHEDYHTAGLYDLGFYTKKTDVGRSSRDGMNVIIS